MRFRFLLVIGVLATCLSPTHGQTELRMHEYWIDDNYDQKVTVSSANAIQQYQIDLSALPLGVHYFNHRTQNIDGEWGAMTRNVFCLRQSDADLSETVSPLAGYEYWLDDDYEHRIYKKSTSSTIVASLSLEELKPGVHYLNFRSHNEDGRWGAMTRNAFYLHEADLASDENALIIGYRYRFGDITTYVAIEPCSEYSLNNKIFNLPEFVEFASLDEGCEFEFSADRVRLKRDNTSVFSLQFENENHKWSSPAILELCVKDTLDRTVVELPVQNSATFSKVPSGDFNAFRLDIRETNNYYFKANQPCRVDLYKEDGSLFKILEAKQIVKLCEAGLIEGRYYGIVRDHVTDSIYADPSVTIRMLLTEGLTPEPTLSFADSLLTMAAMEGAEIFYTLDGSTPTTNSLAYTEPVKVLRNCTAKAIAKHPDLEPSDVSTYKIDTYKVALPEVLFTNLKVYMSCSTPDAQLYYTTDGSDPRENGLLYTEPVTINYNCTIKVVGRRDGYNESEILEYNLDVENARCAIPGFSRNGDTLTLNCLTEGVTFYYTVEGDLESPVYEVYEGTINLSHNCLVLAYAAKDGYLNSETASYTVDWFQAAAPEFDIADNCIVMLCSTEDAEIFYTLDGSTPDQSGQKYERPVPMTEGMIVKAIAYAPNFNPSEVVTFDAENLRCMMPTFSVDNDLLAISTLTEGASIFYTLNGEDPTPTSTCYESPVQLTENCEVKAFAVKAGRADSHVARMVVEWFQTATPEFALDGQLLTISCSTPNAEIYYAIGGCIPDKSAEKYVGSLELADNKVVKAIAYAPHFNDSELAEYVPDVFVCEPVGFKYDGRYASLETPTQNATIYYTANGTTPTTSSDIYDEPIDLNGLTTVKAFALRADFRDSEVSSFTAECYFDGATASISNPGLLSKAFEWCSTEGISTLNIVGSINGDDIALIASLPILSHLNIEEADVDGNTIAARAFAQSPIVSISLPKTIENVGSDLFAGCANLAAIRWNASRSLPSSALSGFSNPNLLLYVKINSHAPSNVTNVVASGYANSITLHDGEGNTNFYCPQEFTARRIEYKHCYTQETIIDDCAGWETFALPFDVQTITHPTRGTLAPFAAKVAEAKPFWLCSLGDYGFVDASEIKANTPYIISMPNNMEYADDYILAGEVTFAAQNAVIPVTTAEGAQKNGFTFYPTTLAMGKSSSIYAFNVGERYENFHPGSLFVSDLRQVRPFEAYLTAEMLQSAPRYMSIAQLGFDEHSAVTLVEDDAIDFKAYGECGKIVVATNRKMHVDVYTSLGMLVRSVDLPVGKSEIDNLIAGVYFVNGKKIMVR